MPRQRPGLLGLAPAALAALVGSSGAGITAASAQDAPAASFPAGIYEGTCDDFGAEPVFQLQDVTYGPPAEAASAGLPTPGTQAGVEILGPPEALYAAVSVSSVDAEIPQLVDPPHSIVVFEAEEAEGQDAIACGPIGGFFTGEELVFGIKELNGSGYAGTGLIRADGEGQRTVTVMLVSLPEVAGMEE